MARAVIRTGSASAAFSSETGEALTLAGLAVADALVGALLVEVSLAASATRGGDFGFQVTGSGASASASTDRVVSSSPASVPRVNLISFRVAHAGADSSVTGDQSVGVDVTSRGVHEGETEIADTFGAVSAHPVTVAVARAVHVARAVTVAVIRA
jgi:hypothetical protein